MKNLLYILMTAFPAMVNAQINSILANELTSFTTPFTTIQVRDTLHDQIFFDSLVKVTSGVTIEMPLRKEICMYSNGSIQFIRYYSGTEPFGEWTFYNNSGKIKYSLLNQKESIYLKTFNGDTIFYKIQKFNSLANLNSAECHERYYYPTGMIKSSGSREPIKVAENFELLESGKWQYYFPSGRLESTGKFKDGKKDGKWIFYDQFGKKARMVNFKAGELISQKEYLK